MFKVENIKMKTIIKSITAITLALLISAGSVLIGTSILEAYAAAANNESTIRIGDNNPMSRDEFLAWSSQRGIRHFRIDGRIYPAGIFFNGHSGQSFSYGELSEGILNVTLRPGVAPTNSGASQSGASVAETSSTSTHVSATPTPTPASAASTTAPQNPDVTSPITFEDMTPILFSDDELTAMVEGVPHAGPLETRSAITLPNRRLTDTELDAWIYEYNYMGGATAFELGVIREVNRVRERYGLPPLALNPALMMSARLKTQEFGDLQYFGHHSPVHGSPSESARMFDFEGAVGEAITQSGSSGIPILRTTPERIVGGMLTSTRGHRDILLSPYVQSVGFGAFFSPNSTGRNGNMSHMFYFATKFEFVID